MGLLSSRSCICSRRPFFPASLTAYSGVPPALATVTAEKTCEADAMNPVRFLLTCCLGVFLAATTVARAGDDVPTADSARVQNLLDRAVARFEKDGELAFGAFSRPGEFVTDDLYVYVVGMDGVLQISGGPSLILVGRDIGDLRDAEGKPFVREILEMARTGRPGNVEYRWLNRQHARIERKVAYFRPVGDRVFVAGYYLPRASEEQAKALLWRAVHELKQEGGKAFAGFNDLNGGFVQDDLYVFVVSTEDGRMRAHGALPRLVGKDVRGLTDADGKPVIAPMLKTAKTKSEGEVDYLWLNPVTRKTERKRSFFVRVDKYLVAVGAYQP
ncbi:cache domain-containing protein [Aromatoleum toluclasticum]|nr:cache domain-containing protein [Aromatoleum toluclasticum]